MRLWWVVLSVLATGCPPPQPVEQPTFTGGVGPPQPAPAARLDDQATVFRFEGGQVELELWRQGQRVTQYAKNRYAVPIVLRWSMSNLDNVVPITAPDGIIILPAATGPNGQPQSVALGEVAILDSSQRYTREINVRARFGDPRAEPTDYAYRLPYPAGLTFAVLQGFHGAFSHRGSNEFAIDFDCPVATPVLAARDGVVVASNAAAQGAGTTPEYLDYKRTNFVLVLHDDGSIGEYMHLSPSGIEVKPGQRVARGDRLALSGNTGFSSTPHLHFQVMTASDDGASVHSFPFKLAVKPKHVEEPVQGRRYSSWE